MPGCQVLGSSGAHARSPFRGSVPRTRGHDWFKDPQNTAQQCRTSSWHSPLDVPKPRVTQGRGSTAATATNWASLLLLAGHLGEVALGHTLDDADGDGAAHVAHGEAAERRVLGEGLDAHGLGRGHDGDAGVAGLDELGVLLENLAGAAVHLLGDLLELAGDVRGVAVEHRGVAVGDLAGVVEHDDLGLEGGAALRGVALGVAADVAALDLLDGDVLHVEADVVAGDGLGHGLVVHLDGLDLGGHAGGREDDGLGRLDDAGLDAADGNCANAADLVHVLEGEAQRLVNGALRRLDGVEGLEEERALVPAHVARAVDHVVAGPARDGDERDLGGLVADLLQVVGDLLHDLLVAGLAVHDGHVVHLVHGDHHLLHAERVGEERVLAGLAVLGDASLEAAEGRVDDEHGDVGLRGAGDHVLDEVAVAGGVDHGVVELGGLELPEGDVDGDATLALGLEVVEHPGVLERGLAELGGLLLELLDGTLVNAAALVDEVASRGGLAGVDVADHDEVDVDLLLSHG